MTGDMTTTSKYNKSNIMKRAWEIKRGRHFSYPRGTRNWSFAKCLSYAWADEKRMVARINEDANKRNRTGEWSAEKVAERNAAIKKTNVSLAYLADTLTDYYANNRYNGD
jgi:hypothetical protein